MKIGNIETDNNIFLAPMAGITDVPFRVLCKKEGCGMTFTEMISAKGIYYKDKKTKELLQIDSLEKPCAVQIFGSDPDIMGQVAAELTDSQISIIDINMGCPTPKIVKNGDGSALMLNPTLAGEIVNKVVKNTDKPVTVKIRKGWDKNNINAVEIAKIAEYNGAQAITVHGRTREQYYGGKADWKIIKEVKQDIDIPVIGNGDIFTAEDAKKMQEYTECDGIMVGRGAKGNPWIFKNVINFFNNGDVNIIPTKEQILDKILEHYELMIKYKGEVISVKEMRKHIAWYIKGLSNSNKVKEDINKCTIFKEVKDILQKYML